MRFIFLLIDGKVMGNSMVAMGNKVEKHIGEIGISLKKEARGMGLGEKLFREVTNKAIKKFKLRILSLDVCGNNKIAQNLYKKMGFEILGTIKGGVNHYNKYEDLIKMVKYLK